MHHNINMISHFGIDQLAQSASSLKLPADYVD